MNIKGKTLVAFQIIMYLCVHTNAQVYKSKVCSSITQEPLEYAIVSLNSSGGKVLFSGVTDSKGEFQIKYVNGATTLKIALLGYKVFEQDVNNKPVLPNIIYLYSSPIELKGVEVVSNREIHDIDKDSYFVTDSMRRGMNSAAEMLGQIKGINYNFYDDSLSVYGQRNILLLVNGIKKSNSYIKNINPKRISRVEVVHNPGGRYLSDNYAAVINLILYEDYVGWDLNIKDRSDVKMSRFNASDWLRKENPEVDYTYTRNKITIDASYHFDRDRKSIYDYIQEDYPNLIKNTSAGSDGKNSNVQKESYEHSFSGGIDYQLSKRHSISFVGDFSYNNDETDAKFFLLTETAKGDQNTTRNHLNHNIFYNGVGTLFYRGKIGNHWDLYSDFNYNYYVDNTKTDNTQTDWISTNNKYRGRKNYTCFNTEATYSFNENIQLKFGYCNTWKEYYATNRLTEIRESQSDDYRNRLFVYLPCQINKEWSTSFGGGMEWIRYRNKNASTNYFAFMPDVRVMYKHSRSLDAVLQYQTSIEYPSLWESSSNKIRSDSIMYSMGNPSLKQSLHHNVFLRVRLWNELTLNSSVNYTKNSIAHFYSETEDGYVLGSYTNANMCIYSVGINYQKMFFKNFIFSSNVSYSRNELRYEGIKRNSDIWEVETNLMYLNRKTGWSAILKYSQRSSKQLLIQGYGDRANNYWLASMQKYFCKNKLSVALGYFPPIKLFIRKNEKNVIDTDFYKSNSCVDVYNYMKNTLMIRLNYRLDFGKRTKKYNNIITVDPEKSIDSKY